MNVPTDLKYAASHEWIQMDGEIGTVGITEHAQAELTDIVYVELPKVGASFGAHDVFGTIEAVKAVSELFSPVAGEVVEVNDRLDREPSVVNSDPYGEGWMVRMRLRDAADREQLLGPDEYAKHIGQ